MARRLRLLSSERPRDREAGFALIEVIVSAAVLAMVAPPSSPASTPPGVRPPALRAWRPDHRARA